MQIPVPVLYLLVPVLVAVLFNCNTSKKQEDNYSIQRSIIYPEKRIKQINDTSFLSLCLDILEKVGKIFISDYKDNKVLCLDTNLQMITKYGGAGKGPELQLFSLP